MQSIIKSHVGDACMYLQCDIDRKATVDIFPILIASILALIMYFIIYKPPSNLL